MALGVLVESGCKTRVRAKVKAPLTQRDTQTECEGEQVLLRDTGGKRPRRKVRAKAGLLDTRHERRQKGGTR